MTAKPMSPERLELARAHAEPRMRSVVGNAYELRGLLAELVAEVDRLRVAAAPPMTLNLSVDLTPEKRDEIAEFLRHQGAPGLLAVDEPDPREVLAAHGWTESGTRWTNTSYGHSVEVDAGEAWFFGFEDADNVGGAEPAVLRAFAALAEESQPDAPERIPVDEFHARISNEQAATTSSPASRPEPPPTASTGPAMHVFVCDDLRADFSGIDAMCAEMMERDAFGRAKYGTPLQAFNGRDALVDAYQEALDLCVYLRQKIAEGDDDRNDYNLALRLAVNLHRRLAKRTVSEGPAPKVDAPMSGREVLAAARDLAPHFTTEDFDRMLGDLRSEGDEP